MISISIIIPVFNAELYIERCLNSIVSQTYSGNIECVIIDDCSTDSSAETAAEIIGRYSGTVKFHIIRHSSNRGLSDARNTGIEASTGDYILFLDSDDELSIHALSLMADEVRKHPGVDIVAGEYYLCRNYAAYHSRHTLPYVEGLQACRRELLREGTLLDTAHNKLVRRNLITDNKLRFRTGIYHEDSLWRWDCAKVVKSIVFLSKPTMVYFNNPGSIVNRPTPKHLTDSLEIIETKLLTIDTADMHPQLRNIATHLASILASPRLAGEAGTADNDETSVRINRLISRTGRKAIAAVSLRAVAAIAIIRLGKLTGSPFMHRLAARTARRIAAL